MGISGVTLRGGWKKAGIEKVANTRRIPYATKVDRGWEEQNLALPLQPRRAMMGYDT
jgi:hypothetical protein